MTDLNALRDPTRTTDIRRRYQAELKRRLRRIRSLVWATVATNDALGLGAPSPIGLQVRAEPALRFDFPTTTAKLGAFMEWLATAEALELFEFGVGPGGMLEGVPAWQAEHVRQVYARAIAQADVAMRRAVARLPVGRGRRRPFLPAGQPIFIIQEPLHAEALEALFTRNFRELKGITAAMDQRISRVLADAFVANDSPTVAARALVREVGLAEARAATMAQTELVRVHAEATLNRLAQHRVPNVRAMGEFVTAGDERVCPDCLELELGPLFTIDEARGIIPVHTGCRCRWDPILVPARDSGLEVRRAA